MLYCWKCRKLISQEPIKIGFRMYCIHCDRDQHVCANCRHHSPGKHNECNVPGTEWIKDREAMNYCEDFEVKPEQTTNASGPKSDPLKGLKSLFKDDDA